MKTLVCILALLASAETLAATQTPKSSTGGRFQVLQISDMRRDQIMIDTQTGKVWHIVCMVADGNDCAYSAWRADDVEGITHTKAQIIKEADDLRKYIQENRKPSSPSEQ